MTITDARRRAVARTAARTAALFCAVGLSISVWGLSTNGLDRASAAAIDGGPAVIVATTGTPGSELPLLDAGGSATEFSLRLPTQAACTGDSANDSYRVQSYLVTSSVAPSAITFNADGPIPAVGAFATALLDETGEFWLGALTAPASPAPGPGPVINIPAFSFAGFPQGYVPAGTYNIGIACSKGPAGPAQLDKFWNATIEIVADPADEPAGLTWSVVAPQEATTTTTDPQSTTTTSASAGSTTTTTAPRGTSSTSSTTPGAAVMASGSGPSSGVGQSLSALPATGGSIGEPVVWGVLLAIFGRMAILLGRPPRVLPAIAS